MNYSISKILEISRGELINEGLVETIISEVFFDTRRGPYGPNNLFLAIDGVNADGHHYIGSAYKSLGCRHFLVSKKVTCEDYPGANFILVEDVVASLQKIAIHHRNEHQLQSIGITGSNGKTIVKEWIFQLCNSRFDIVRSPASYNSQMGVPLSILKIKNENDLGIFEAGISGRDNMASLAKVIQPQIGVFTNIGEAHSAGFDSIEEKVKEKLKLFDSCEKIIYCRDHAMIHQEIKDAQEDLVTWSAQGKDAKYKVVYGDFSLKVNGQLFPIAFDDLLSKENASHAIVTALELGIESPSTQELISLKMRLEMKHGINNCFLINDAYNSDFDALKSALTILEQQQKKQRNTLILSQIEESKIDPREGNTRIKRLVEAHQIDRLITVGEEIMSLDFKGEHLKFKSTEDLLKQMGNIDFQNENILIKGARKFSLEQVFDSLSVKVHQTILEINLESMRHNLMEYRSLLKADTKIMVVLKASGYGSGSLQLSRFLEYQRVDYIAVAYVDEGIELRKAGIKVPIMVMNPEERGFAAMIEYHLEPEIYSVDQLKKFASYSKNQSLNVHLKIETGMHRLGIEEDAYQDVCALLNANPLILVKSIFAHFVGSDDPAFDDFSLQQVKRFSAAHEKISKAIGYQPDRHILNSNGISRFTEFQFEMVRLGIGLHGLTRDPKLKERLIKVQTLKTKIAQIKKIGKGDSIGYNRTFIAKSSRTIATINIGYADGLPRNAGNGKYHVLVNGKDAALILGNVCMDMCMIDISECSANVGDEVTIFGPKWPIEKLASVCGTIHHEILTRLSTRIHRIFSRE